MLWFDVWIKITRLPVWELISFIRSILVSDWFFVLFTMISKFLLYFVYFIQNVMRHVWHVMVQMRSHALNVALDSTWTILMRKLHLNVYRESQIQIVITIKIYYEQFEKNARSWLMLTHIHIKSIYQCIYCYNLSAH